MSSRRLSLEPSTILTLPVKIITAFRDDYQELPLIREELRTLDIKSLEFVERILVLKPTIRFSYHLVSRFFSQEVEIFHPLAAIPFAQLHRFALDFPALTRHHLRQLEGPWTCDLTFDFAGVKDQFERENGEEAKKHTSGLRDYFASVRALEGQGINPYAPVAREILDTVPDFRATLREIAAVEESLRPVELFFHVAVCDKYRAAIGKRRHLLPVECRWVAERASPEILVNCSACGSRLVDGLFCVNGHYLCPSHTPSCVECHKPLCDVCHDPRHKCAKCERLVCEEHISRCRYCRTPMCHGHQIPCKLCEEPSCYQCMSACQRCGHLFCQSHIGNCHRPECQKQVCHIDSQPCDSCGKRSCAEHLLEESPGRFICPEHATHCAICTRARENEQLVECPECRDRICETHQRTCRMCGKTGCDKHFFQPVSGESISYCWGHLKPCPHCDEKFLETEFESCVYCGREMCRNCGKRCVLCRQFGCPSHFFTNRQGNLLCENEVGQCQECSEKMELTALFKCQTCAKLLCSPHLAKCHFCDSFGCKSHYVDYYFKNLKVRLCADHRFICSTCEKPMEKGERKICQICNDTLCAEHHVMCAHCSLSGCRVHFFQKPDGTLICENHFINCQICKKTVNLKDGGGCMICRKYHCPDHLFDCHSCRFRVCGNEFSTCFTCEQRYCARCLGFDGRCKTCQNLGEEQPLPQRAFNLLEEPQFITAVEKGNYKWGENQSYYYIQISVQRLFGKGPSFLIVIDKSAGRIKVQKEVKG